MEFPATVYIALGAMATALITRAFSFVNLMIAKDQKTSEFCQEWIDRLREDISAFTSQVESASALYDYALKDDADRFKDPEVHQNFFNSITPNLRDNSRDTIFNY